MKRIENSGKIFLWTLAVFLLALQTPSAWSKAAGEQGIMVGRISFIDGGQLLRYVPEQKDWVVVVKDAPFGFNDALYTADNTKAEFIMPTGTSIRVGEKTQIQLITLREGLTEADVASGTARFNNKSEGGLIKITTPFGYVVGPAGSNFDLYVGDQSAEVVSLQGTVDFIHIGNQAKFQVTAGSTSIVADAQNVTSGSGQVSTAWNEWNVSRDGMLAKRTEVKGESRQYLPQNLSDDAYDLDQNGRWEKVNYEGESRNVWRPANVDADWTPYSVGRWTDYYGDNAWIPDEPFGYVTMHYGNWLMVDNGWFWSPPVFGVGIARSCPYCWSPGRVGWLYSEGDVGWFPLAASEPFYSTNYWGGGAVVLNNVNINVNVNDYRFANHAVIVNQNALYSTNNYRNARLRNIDGSTIARNFQAAPVLSDRAVKNFSQNKERFAFTNKAASVKPSPAALGRITGNQRIARQASRENPRTIQQRVARARHGKIAQNARIASPTLGNKPVNPGGVKASGVAAGTHERARIGQPQPSSRSGIVGASSPKPDQAGRGRVMVRPATPKPPTKQQVGRAGPASPGGKQMARPQQPRMSSKPGETAAGAQSQQQRQALKPAPQARQPKAQVAAQPKPATPRAQSQPQRQAVTPRPKARPPRQQAVAPRAQPQPQRQAVTPRPQARPPRQQAIAPRAQPQPQRQAVTPRPQARPPRQQAVAPRPQAQPPRKQAVAPRPQAAPPRAQVAAPRPKAAPPRAAAPAAPVKKCPPGVVKC